MSQIPIDNASGDYLSSADGAVTGKRYRAVIVVVDTIFTSLALSASAGTTGGERLVGPTLPAGTIIRGNCSGLEVATGLVFGVTGLSSR